MMMKIMLRRKPKILQSKSRSMPMKTERTTKMRTKVSIKAKMETKTTI